MEVSLWVVMAVKIAGIWTAVLFIINGIFYRKDLKAIRNKIFSLKG